MNLYLHAGAHKTASSFLQSALKENQEQLFDKGLKVVLRKNVINSPFQQALECIKEGRVNDQEKLDAGKDSLIKMLPKKSNIDCLITNEDLFCNLKLQDFYPNLKRQLEFVANSVPKGVTPKFILYIRRQADYIESVYMQYIHLGRSLSFESYLGEGLPKFLSWLDVANTAKEVFGKENVLIKPFETIKTLGAKAFYFDFLKELGDNLENGLSFNEAVATDRGANRSYSALGMEIAKRINPILESKADKNNLRSFLQSKFSTATHEKARFLSNEEKSEIFEIYKAGNKELFGNYVSTSKGSELAYF